MAQTVTLEGLRDQIIKSIEGRKLGFSYGAPGSTTVIGKETQPDFLVGVKAVRMPVVTLTSATTATSTADQIPNYGVCILNPTTWLSTAFNPVTPVPGVSVQLYNLTSGIQTIYVNNSTLTTGVTFVSMASSGAGGTTAGTAFTLTKNGWAELVGLTTSQWYLRTQMGSSVTTGSSLTTAG